MTRQKRRLAAGIVLDSSGSMQRIRNATISGVNEWLGDQRREDSTDMDLLLVPFASSVERIEGPADVRQFSDLTPQSYDPEGNTALYDGVMTCISKLETLDADAYMVLIVTDGEENCSHEYDLAKTRAKIEQLTATGRWTFVYLGANVDAWSVAGAMGVQSGNVANYAATPTSAGAMYIASSGSARRWRQDVADNADRLIASSLVDENDEVAVRSVLRSHGLVSNSNYAAEAQASAPDLNPTTAPQAPNLPPSGTITTPRGPTK